MSKTTWIILGIIVFVIIICLIIFFINKNKNKSSSEKSEKNSELMKGEEISVKEIDTSEVEINNGDAIKLVD